MPIPASGSSISVDDVKERANKTLTQGEDEIQDMIDAALRRYARRVGPLEVTSNVAVVTPAYLSDGFAGIYLPHRPVVAVSGVTDGYGTTVAAADYLLADAAQGLIRPAADGAISLTTTWPRQMVVTYTYGGLDEDDREAIIADVVGYFAATQRGAVGRMAFPSEAAVEAFDAVGSPLRLFPRIDALAQERNAGAIA